MKGGSPPRPAAVCCGRLRAGRFRAFALRNDLADVSLTMLFGVLGFVMRRYDLPVPPLVMGVILGPMAEAYFLTSMVSSGNDLTVFLTRPVSAVVLAASVLLVAWPLVRRRRAA